MNRTEKMKLKKILLEKREEIIKKVKNIRQDVLGKSQRDASGDLSGYSIHMADVASDNFERELFVGLAEGERELLYQIDEALRRLSDKNFDKCQSCGKKITMKRLIAVPYATLCKKCKENEEKQKHP